jgi:hypothetical protein
MSDLQPYGVSNLPATADTRRAARHVSRFQAGAQVRLAAIDSETDVALGKIDAATATSAQAMAAVIRVAQLHKNLELLAPEAAGRLAYLADVHMVGMGETVVELQRQLWRK